MKEEVCHFCKGGAVDKFKDKHELCVLEAFGVRAEYVSKSCCWCLHECIAALGEKGYDSGVFAKCMGKDVD